MTITLGPVPGWDTGGPASGGIFTRSVMRDLTGLNRQFLELGLRHGPEADPLFSWSEEVRRKVHGASSSVRDRMSACPFALFEIHLPPRDAAPGGDSISDLDRVEDRPQGAVAAVVRPAGCIAFAHGALFTAWRLADSAPLAARIAFGLSAAVELELNETCSTRIALLAALPGVVRARWPGHARFWGMLASAAQVESDDLMRRAHCFGICLMDVDHSEVNTGEPAAQQESGHR